MSSKATKGFWRLYGSLPADVQRQAREAYKVFSENPQHPGLRFKRVHPSQPIYSARVSVRHRAIGVLERDTIIWFWIGDHDAYQRLLASI